MKKTVWERLLPKICFSDDCWEWTASINNRGYGTFNMQGVVKGAHVVMYELLVGPVPAGMELDHLCHDPVECSGEGNDCKHRRCVRPSHLEVVPRRENALRSGSLAAANARKTHCMRGHELSGENLYIVGTTGARQCSTCRTLRDRSRSRKKV